MEPELKALVEKQEQSKLRSFGSMCYYVGFVILGLYFLPNAIWDPQTKDLVLVIGAVGIFRYGWWCVHAVRSLIYTHIAYPIIRKRAEAAWEEKKPKEVFFQMTTYHEDEHTTKLVLMSIIRELRLAKIPGTLVVGTGTDFDEKIMDQYFKDNPPDIPFKYLYVRQKNPGKRHAIGAVLRKVREMNPERCPIVFMDGDSIFDEWALIRSLKILCTQKNVAGVTTDEKAVIEGPRWVQDFFDMRFAIRNIQMRSVSLSRKLLALTGRMSILWTNDTTEMKFIEIIENDHLDHWYWGRFRFLSGDDKSSWYNLLRKAYNMLYVPDAMVYTVEQIDDKDTVSRVRQNLLRWSGNMMRNGSRALLLGPKKTGWFLWYCLIDQRIAMWTSISGLFAAIAFSVCTVLNNLFGFTSLPSNPAFLLGFILWLMLTRFLQSCLLFYYNRGVNMTFPFLLYFNQIVGSWLKIYMMFRLPLQRWANRKDQKSGFDDYSRRKQVFANYMNVVSVGLFMFIVLVATGILKVPNFFEIFRSALSG